MARTKKNTTIDGGPSLFPSDAEAVLKNADRFDAVYNDLLRRRDMYEQTGIYSPFIPDTLRNTAKVFYCNIADWLRDTLTASGLTADTIEAVTTDYITVLCGPLDFTATPEQINEALTTLTPLQAFLIDKYALYFVLFLNYSKFEGIAEEYAEQVAAPDATEQTKRGFMAVPRPMNAKGVCWLIEHGISKITDWLGIQPAEVSAFISAQRDWAALNEYTYFYFIAKSLYNATPQELAAIKTPPINTNVPITEIGPIYAEAYEKEIQAKIQLFSNLAEKKKRDNREKYDEAVKQTNAEVSLKIKEIPDLSPSQKTPTQPKKNPYGKGVTVKVPACFGSILSRDIYISPNGEKINGVLPIQPYIEKFINNNNIQCDITPRTIEKAIEGVNMLQLYHPVTPINGYFTYKTNLTELSTLCGYADANQTEKYELLQALRVLDWAAWLVVWKAKGPTAVRVLTITEISKDGLTINVTTEARKGRPNLITAEGYKLLRQQAKGAAKNHFRHQILNKTNIREDDLLNEVFGYDYTRAKLKGNAEELAKYENYIRKHKTDDKKKIQTWFDEYQSIGALRSYRRYSSGGAVVYSWIKGTLLRGDEQEPDEQ